MIKSVRFSPDLIKWYLPIFFRSNILTCVIHILDWGYHPIQRRYLSTASQTKLWYIWLDLKNFREIQLWYLSLQKPQKRKKRYISKTIRSVESRSKNFCINSHSSKIYSIVLISLLQREHLYQSTFFNLHVCKKCLLLIF